MPEPIVITPYDVRWAERFDRLGSRIRDHVGTTALRIDHIGSTAVTGLAAKPVIDIQVSIQSLADIDTVKPLLEQAGFMYRGDNPDLTKRYFREKPGTPRTHIHVRQAGSWSEQFALLFRDYLRSAPAECELYARAKYELMERFKDERRLYVEGKEPVIWDIMRRASGWSQYTGWMPGESDK